MTDEKRNILIEDLFGRLRHEVVIKLLPNNEDEYLYGARVNGGKWMINDAYYVEEIRPYLRPLSSMTEEEDLEFIGIGLSVVNYGTNGNAKHKCKLSVPEIDWLNAHYFDYRGLIPMGLALSAPEGMYDNKTK